MGWPQRFVEEPRGRAPDAILPSSSAGATQEEGEDKQKREEEEKIGIETYETQP